MGTIRSLLVLAALTTLLSGCGAGIIYTHTLQPLSLDMHRTPVSQTGKTGDIKLISIGMMGVAWDSAGIGDIAKKNGLTEVYFADLEIFSVLSIWNQYTAHVYGK
jgi:hypothetical protein